MSVDYLKAQETSSFFRTASLRDIGLKLVQDGPHKFEKATRRVRGLLAQHYLFDTTNALYVWEHPYYPQFYVPESTLVGKSLSKTEFIDADSSAFLARITVGSGTTDRVILFEKGPLAGFVRIEFAALDAWFEEDQRIYGHPKDPYKRIDILPSSRKITVKVDNVVVCESTTNMFLFETLLRPRYYIPLSLAQWKYLTVSETTSVCPYKGVANYYNVVVNGKEYKDIIWWYKYPTAESAPIAGHLCFYNEKVEILVDDEPEAQRP